MNDIIMSQQDLLDFKQYAIDHMREFEAWPCEFETDRGHVLDATQCMFLVNTVFN
jgi:hypothetical protein